MAAKKFDQIIDTRVDIAIAEVTNETSWSDRLQSLANSGIAATGDTMVAERVYRSDAVKAGIEDLASGVAKEVGKTIELASSDATGRVRLPQGLCRPTLRRGRRRCPSRAMRAKVVVVDPTRPTGGVSAGWFKGIDWRPCGGHDS